GDGCDHNCTITACGNGILTPATGERCDDGNTTDGDGCDHNCTVTACGNGIVTPATGEQCDDGNTTNGDGCDNNCKVTGCGNATMTPGEQCDDGNTTDGDGCSHDCKTDRCGDGIVTPPEQCDDGNTDDDDDCHNDCTAPRCGNGIIERGEECDLGPPPSGNGPLAVCDTNCRSNPRYYCTNPKPAFVRAASFKRTRAATGTGDDMWVTKGDVVLEGPVDPIGQNVSIVFTQGTDADDPSAFEATKTPGDPVPFTQRPGKPKWTFFDLEDQQAKRWIKGQLRLSFGKMKYLYAGQRA